MLLLSNYGLRYLQHQRRLHPKLDTPTLSALVSVTRKPFEGDPLQLDLLQRGLIQRVSPQTPPDAVRLRYLRNPLEHVERIVFELTRACDLRCGHCRNQDRENPPQDLKALKATIDAARPLGIDRFDFIGGEVTRFAPDLFALLRHAQSGGPAQAVILSNGGFLGQRDIKTPAGTFSDDLAYLRALKAAGLTHMVYSLDGPAEIHDEGRGVEGLHDRILEGIKTTRAAGLSPQVSLVYKQDRLDERFAGWMEDLATTLYGRPDVEALMRDSFNYGSNFIDIGSGAALSTPQFLLDELTPARLRCKGFFRPYPSLRIKANGALSLCPLVSAGDVDAGVSDSGGFISAVNGLQGELIYKVHAESRIADYLPYLDRDLFPKAFEHPCTPRAILTLLAKRVEAEGVTDAADPRLREINEAVARETGHSSAGDAEA